MLPRHIRRRPPAKRYRINRNYRPPSRCAAGAGSARGATARPIPIGLHQKNFQPHDQAGRQHHHHHQAAAAVDADRQWIRRRQARGVHTAEPATTR